MFVTFFANRNNLAFFCLDGNMPVTRPCLKIVSRFFVVAQHIFNMRVLMSSWPFALFELKFWILFLILFIERATVDFYSFLVTSLSPVESSPWTSISGQCFFLLLFSMLNIYTLNIKNTVTRYISNWYTQE